MRHVQTILTDYIPAERDIAMDDLRELLSKDPILKTLAAKAQVEDAEPPDAGEIPDDIVDAVVIEDPTRAITGYLPIEEYDPDVDD
jgi:hypothetical protein